MTDLQPIELYEFIGTYSNYYMTSDYIAHAFKGNNFRSVPGLKRSTLKIGTHEDDNANITITIPIGNQIVNDYAYQTTPPSLSLTVYRVDRETGSFIIYWKGSVSSIITDSENAKFKVPSRFSQMLSGNIPNVYIQPPCNNVLFDNLCKVSRSSNSLKTTVSSVGTLVIKVASLGSFPDGWFRGGEIVVTSRNERRMITSQNGTELVVNYQFSKLDVGENVQVTAGCDHSFKGANGCAKFNNQKNFGGLPYVPGESNNVFSSGVS